MALDPAATWGRILRVYATLGRELNASLLARHAITLSDYEVLLRLGAAPGKRLRRVDLAGQVLLSPSGITRLLDGLERAGLVCRAECSADRRVVYAELTDAGEALVRAAGDTHGSDVQRILGDRLDDEELRTLDGLLARLPGGEENGSCRV